jgi:hypothetical protein
MKNTFDTKTVFVRTALAAFCLVFGSVAVSVLAGETRAATIETNLQTGPFPWTKAQADTGAGKFAFAVFSDLSGGEREGVFEVAIEQLNLLRPELIMNVGDLIEGGTDDVAELAAQWDAFDERARRARAPLFYAGGNHDLTGEVLREVWRERNGPLYYHFVYKNVLFLVLDTEDNTAERMQEIHAARDKAVAIYKTEGPEAFARTEYATMPERSAGTVSAEQSRYFVEAIEENPGVRWTFVFIHKPAWEREGEKNFAAIEAALADRPYTVFNGHVQAYAYRQRHGRDYIQLATTGGEQFPKLGRSVDHVTLVTVDSEGVDIVNLLLSGILDKTGHVPLEGDHLCFEISVCGDDSKLN